MVINNSYPRGSEWRKWDLHIHSPLSILNNQFPRLSNGELDWESFINKLESLNVAVIGITDYFTIEGYKRLREFKEHGQLVNIHTILPNIEFRLKNIISSRRDSREPRRLNFHVIFSSEVPVADIEEHFLHDISFYYEGNPQDRDDTRKLKLSNLENLGKELLSQHKPFRDRGFHPLEVGAMQAVVDHEDITKILISDGRFKGKYIIVLPEELQCLIDWDGQDHHTRKGLLQKSDMVFSSNPKTRQWCLGKDPYTEGEKHFIKEFKTLKPCIHGSDAHKIEEIGHPCIKRAEHRHSCIDNPDDCEPRYCWVKADPTFEGFKQLLYEPEDRVIIQKQNPTPVTSNYTINKISINGAKINNELTLEDTNLELNTALVAVIGGKGAGKTALVDLVANCYKDRCIEGNENSFVKRIVDDNPEIKTRLSFKDGGEFSKHLTEKNFLEESQFVYISQGELEEYIGKKSDLDQRIRDLIFESPQIKDSILSFEFADSIEKVETLNEKISAKNQQIEKLEQKTSQTVERNIERTKKKIVADLKDIEKRIREVEKLQSKKDIEVAQKKQKELGELKSNKDNLISLRDSLQKVIGFLEEQIPEFNEIIEVINELLKKLDFKERYEALSYPKKKNLETMLASVKKDIAKIVSAVDKGQKETERLERRIREHTKLLDRKRELGVATKNVEKQEKTLAEEKRQLEQAAQQRKQLITQLFKGIVLQKKKYGEIIDIFSAQKADVLSDLDFVAEIHFDADRFIKGAKSVLDNRKVLNIEGNENTESIFETLIKLSYAVADGQESEIGNLVNEIEQCNEKLKSKIKSGGPITSSDFYNFLYGNYMRVIPVVRFKKISLEKTSLGQKASVLIKIYLAQGDKPIIIDSHDDHLDNEFIMDELVKAIRQAKCYRQVILVSNNGNVVINSDAEQIIIASHKKGKISYISGAIEEPVIRDKAVRVLEGGSEAFRKRQQKYRIGT